MRRSITVLAFAVLSAVAGPVHPQNSPATGGTAAAPQIQWRTVADAAALPLDQYIYVEARLLSKQAPQPGTKQPYSYFIADDTGSIRVVAFADVHDKIPNADQFEKDSTLQIYGLTSEFKGQRQLVVKEPKYMRLKPGSQKGSARFKASTPMNEAGFIPVSIGTITLQTVGRDVTITGTISEVIPSPNERTPTKIKVKDETGEITVVYWKDVQTALDKSLKIEKGQPIRVSGKTQEYRTTLQLRLDDPANISQPAAPEEAFGAAATPAAGR